MVLNAQASGAEYLGLCDVNCISRCGVKYVVPCGVKMGVLLLLLGFVFLLLLFVCLFLPAWCAVCWSV